MSVVDAYLAEFFADQPTLSEIRRLLTDDFWFRGPLLNADSAQDYVDALRQLGVGGLKATDIQITQGGSDLVAVLYNLVTPSTVVPTSEWFWLRENKIRGIRLSNDPRPILSSFSSL